MITTRTKPKRLSRVERAGTLRDRLVGLPEELIGKGFGAHFKPAEVINLLEDPDKDPKTGGYIGKAKEPLAVYLQRVSVEGNFSQRPPFDHTRDPIYRRLIRDFIDGAIMPESKVAALTVDNSGKAKDLSHPSIVFSLIDGLQRLYCYGIAVLLVLQRQALIDEGVIDEDTWQYFQEVVEKTGEDPKAATDTLLKRPMRYEIFWNIDLQGLLHYMVTFNTGQRKMGLKVQLEIMQQPLINELTRRSKVSVQRDIEKLPGARREKEKFAASDLVIAVQAFILSTPHVTAGKQAERLLEDEQFLENFGDVEDVIEVLKRIGGDLHPAITHAYAEDPHTRYILTDSSMFLMGLMAACGYIRNKNNMKMLDGALDKLMEFIKKTPDDPLNLAEYRDVVSQIKGSRGKTIRTIVNDTFRRFFMGATVELDWADSAQPYL